jgi:hypothetical protein
MKIQKIEMNMKNFNEWGKIKNKLVKKAGKYKANDRKIWAKKIECKKLIYIFFCLVIYMNIFLKPFSNSCSQTCH